MPTPPHLADLALTTARPEDFDATYDVALRAFQEEAPDEAREFDRKVLAGERLFGFTTGGRWVSTFGAFARSVTVPGGAALPAAAVTVVTVLASFRRRGLLTAMMREHLQDSTRRGEPLSVLWASESGIYGRFGYGQAAPRARLSGRTRSLAFRPDVDLGDGSVDEIEREEFLAVAPAINNALIPARPGSLDRPEKFWPMAVYDLSFARDGATSLRYVVHYDRNGTVDGYTTYRVKDDGDITGPAGEVRIGEVKALNPAAYAALWRYLLDLDLVRTFRCGNAPLDAPLRHLAADPRAIHTEVLDGIYLRVVDVPAALRARSYATEVDLVIEVTDPILEHNNGRFALRAGEDGATVRRARRRPDLSLGIRELGAVYLGGPRLAELHAAGLLVEHRPGAVAAASTAFGGGVAPHCSDNF
jgi:predicted acetyltransferase